MEPQDIPLDNLYQEIILDHFKNPRNKCEIQDSNIKKYDTNPFCGDEILISAIIENGRIKKICFDGRGCSISQASASMMTEKVLNMTVQEVQKFISKLITFMRGEIEISESELGDLESLKGVRNYPVRIKCALLPWITLEKALTEKLYTVEKNE